jgi:D-beta-D-heptose 7-phosphate kinase/D-beta-D-heptose 1-phosphate adenosyltransferase
MDIQQQKQFKILLLGDNCIDVYQYGTVDRISPEAPVPVFKFSHEEKRAGMAGNVKNNLISLGADVTFLHGETSTKTRLVDLKSKQHIVRIDNDVLSDAFVFDTSIPKLYDAIVISDYNKGTISYEMVEELIADFKGPVFIDTKKTDLKRFEGAIVKINSLENSLAKTLPTELIVTMGRYGAQYKDQQYSAPHTEVFDVCGAGDTFLSALVLEFLKTNNMEKAIEIANIAASITVKHIGVYAPTWEEINEA